MITLGKADPKSPTKASSRPVTDGEKDESVPTIYFASRTHTQLAQVIKELKVKPPFLPPPFIHLQ